MKQPQTIALTTVRPALTLRALRGDTAPVPVGGFGGWSLVARPRRKALTQWDGVAPFQMQLSLIFDGVADNESVEAQCKILERMAQPVGALQPPPVVHVTGAVPHPELAYVIGDGNGGAGLAWDTEPVYSVSGYRIRQQVTIMLLEHVPVGRAAGLGGAAASARANGGGTSGHTYTVKAGDTLMTIAAAKLGSVKRWPEIAKLNNLHSPYKLRVGQVLRLP